MKTTLLLVVFVLASLARCAQLDFAGILGNSGIAGETLVRVNTSLRGQDGTGVNSGVYLDRRMRVWTSGGDAVNCLSFDGRLLRRYPLTPPGSRIDSTAFAVLDGVLYALGHLPKPGEQVALFAVPLDGATEAKCVLPAFPTWRGALCPTPREGKLLLAYSADGKNVNIDTFDPKEGTLQRFLSLPGSFASALAIDPEDGELIIGGYFGKYVGASIHQPTVHEMVKLGWDGTVRWRTECLETPANPTQFRGVVSAAGGALWDSAWYGFFARFDRTGKSAPGKVLSWDMRVPYISQVLDVRQGTPLLPADGVAESYDPLLLATQNPEQVYLAMWDADAQEVKLQQRYGALPGLGNVYLSSTGWVFADGKWWRFDDAANAAPSFANYIARPGTPGAFRGDWVCMLRQDGQPSVPCVARPALGRESAQNSWGQRAPFKQPLGFAVDNPNAPVVWAYATEAGSTRIWRAVMDLREWVPVGNSWKALTIDGEGLTAPGDIAVLADGRLVVADGGAVVFLQQAGDAWQVKGRMTKWGDAPDQQFGAHLRLAADGNNLLVSDTDRHRVVLFIIRGTHCYPCARYGSTDVAGSSELQFSSPGAVAIAGNRAIVADVDNQRIVKLRLAEDRPTSFSWLTRKPVVEDGKIVDWAPAPEFFRQTDVIHDDGGGTVISHVKLTGPFHPGAWSQHAGVVLQVDPPIPAHTPFTVEARIRSISGSTYLTVYRSWGSSTPWETIPITTDWKAYAIRRVASHSTEFITLSLVAKRGGLQPYCAGEFEMEDVRVSVSP